MDIALWAHEHEYQRMWPVYDRKVYNGTTSSNPYEDPGAPVHLVTGSAVSCSPVVLHTYILCTFSWVVLINYLVIRFSTSMHLILQSKWHYWLLCYRISHSIVLCWQIKNLSKNCSETASSQLYSFWHMVKPSLMFAVSHRWNIA